MFKNLFITKQAQKHWKKEIAKGHLQIAAHEDKIYLLNTYNAFIVPQNTLMYEYLIQPATLRPAPDGGEAQVWHNGTYYQAAAAETIHIIKGIMEKSSNAVTRTPFSFDDENEQTLRIYTLPDGQHITINQKYDAMIDHKQDCHITGSGPKSPIVFTDASELFTAILLPVLCARLDAHIQALAERSNG